MLVIVQSRATLLCGSLCAVLCGSLCAVLCGSQCTALCGSLCTALCGSQCTALCGSLYAVLYGSLCTALVFAVSLRVSLIPIAPDRPCLGSFPFATTLLCYIFVSAFSSASFTLDKNKLAILPHLRKTP